MPVQPAPLSETVDHTVEEDVAGPPQKAFQNHSPSLSPSPSQTVSSPASSSEDEDSEEEEDRNNRSESGLPIGHTHNTSPSVTGV